MLTERMADTARRRVLLLSNSTQHGHGYLDHAAEVIAEHFAGARRIAFVPYALHDWDGYAAAVAERLGRLDLEVAGVHAAGRRPADVVADCDGVFVGGGNTFRLLTGLYAADLLGPLRARVEGGMPYLGSSAGTNVACPSIRTTNDMPIVEPPSFAALGLLGFHINPHYLDAPLSATHMGETRGKRLEEYLEENDVPVLAVPEGSWVGVTGRGVRLGGACDGVLFNRGEEPRAVPLGADLSHIEPGES